MEQKDFFDDFKPIRNKLKDFNLFDNLYVISQYYYASKRMNWQYLPLIEDSQLNKILVGEIDFLIANSILYCHLLPTQKSIRLGFYRGRLLYPLNKLKDVVDNYSIQKNAWLWFNSFAFNQEKMNRSSLIDSLYRYIIIYRDKQLAAAINDKLGMQYEDYLMCAFWFYCIFSKGKFNVDRSFFYSLPIEYEKTPLKKCNIQKTLELLSSNISFLKDELKKNVSYYNNEIFNYMFSPHIIYPIIEHQDKLYCVISDYIVRQITLGIYYLIDIPNNSDLSKYFGKGFERYIGVVLKRCNRNNKYSIYKEIILNAPKGIKRSSDWIIKDENTILFLECKTKKLRDDSKVELSVESGGTLENDLIKIAKAVSQVYKSYWDYKRGLYNELAFEDLNFVPIVIVLEEWYAGNPSINEKIQELLPNFLPKEILEENLFQTNPFIIYSCDRFERDMSVMGRIGISKFFELKEKNKLEDYIKTIKVDHLFINDFEKDFIDPYRDLLK